MTTYNPVIFDPVTKELLSIPSGDTLTPSVTPLSARPNNDLQILGDGLYVGNQTLGPILYIDSTTGLDSLGRGFTRNTPLLTLDYALSTILGGQLTNTNLTISLKAGEGFVMINNFLLNNSKLIINSYGDATGDGGTLIAGTTTYVDYGIALARPFISPVSTSTNGYYGCAQFVLQDNSRLTFSGLQILLPNNPGGINPSAYGIYSDVVLCPNDHLGSFAIKGCIINIQDSNSLCGLLGVHARSIGCTFSEYASQFLVGGQKVVAGASVANLNARANFIKMYNDFAGNDQVSTSVNPTSLNSSPGTSILKLMWSDTASQIIQGNSYNLGTYPLLTDAAYGLKYYFTGLVRDQQSRPLNLQSGRLL